MKEYHSLAIFVSDTEQKLFVSNFSEIYEKKSVEINDKKSFLRFPFDFNNLSITSITLP